MSRRLLSSSSADGHFVQLDGGRAYAYKDELGFECVGTYGDPPFYAIVARDEHVIHCRRVDAPTAYPEKYAEELLDVYLLVEDANALYAGYAGKGVEFARELGDMQ
jgi:hypothetical protein